MPMYLEGVSSFQTEEWVQHGLWSRFINWNPINCLESTEMKNSQDRPERIAVNPKIMGGKPVVKGTRVTVEQILRLMPQGLSMEENLKDYPHLCREDISAVLLYAAKLTEEEAYPITAT
jgi:uncharacterized protein (DUF433 family)